MNKLFVVDTNVVLFDHTCIYNFKEHDVALSIVVLEELDRFKRGNDLINLEAREFIRELDRLAGDGSLTDGLPLGPDRGRLYVEVGGSGPSRVTQAFAQSKPDHRILALADELRARRRGIEGRLHGGHPADRHPVPRQPVERPDALDRPDEGPGALRPREPRQGRAERPRRAGQHSPLASDGRFDHLSTPLYKYSDGRAWRLRGAFKARRRRLELALRRGGATQKSPAAALRSLRGALLAAPRSPHKH